LGGRLRSFPINSGTGGQFGCAGIGGFLQGDQFAHQLVGQAEAAVLGHGAGQLFGLHRAPGFFPETAAEILVVGAFEAGEHFLGQHGEEDAFEVFRLLPQVRVLAGRQAGADAGGIHHSTSISAGRAPVALIACRMAMRSRGEMPSALRPSTSCCSVTDSCTTCRAVSVWLTLRSVLGSIAVRPGENGAGCTTSGFSAMVTVRFDWATATLETRTSWPMTMMPAFSSMTMRAAWSVCATSVSLSVSRSPILPLQFGGSVSRTVAGSSGRAVGAPMKSSTASAVRRAGVRSGLRRASRSERWVPSA